MVTKFYVARHLEKKSQLQVAAESGIHVSVVSQLENGWRIPTPDQLKKLKKALTRLEEAEVLVK
jgi:transcriptional regulator with XRE-family HTH domain